jgi:hypothetical protein
MGLSDPGRDALLVGKKVQAFRDRVQALERLKSLEVLSDQPSRQ